MKTLLISFTLLVPCMLHYDDQKPVFSPFHGHRHPIARYYYRYRYTVSPQLLRQNEIVKTVAPKNPNLKLTFFPPVINQQNNIKKFATASKYPWIARVYHSPDKAAPHICTAACVDERILITAARCLAQAKVAMMNVIYQGAVLRPIALVVPTKPTKQWFDDIGFIILDRKFKKKWETVKVHDKWKRTDNNFKWFGKIPMFEGTAVGFAPMANKPNIYLYDTAVYVSNYLCYYLYNVNDKGDSYFVPCYHTCTLEEAYKNHPNCQTHLAGEGHVVLDKTQQLVGVATWAGYYKGAEGPRTMPVGMAIPNTDTYRKDLECAKKIRDAPETTKSFVKLC